MALYVARDFEQIEDINYAGTFAPIGKPETANEIFSMRQMDVNAAYLHPQSKEEIYLEQPPFLCN